MSGCVTETLSRRPATVSQEDGAAHFLRVMRWLQTQETPEQRAYRIIATARQQFVMPTTPPPRIRKDRL